MKFNVNKYVKGSQDRGFVLGACDEVLQALDDHTMALQSMAGSRFIGPFLATVQQWEKSLSLIAEVNWRTSNSDSSIRSSLSSGHRTLDQRATEMDVSRR